MNAPFYRSRNAGHDYYGRGVYLITLVIGGRTPLLGMLGADPKHPEVRLSPLGEKVRQEWETIPARQKSHGNKVAVLTSVCMPDHFHGVIEVLEPMQWSLGEIIQAFKATCTSYWQEQRGQPSSTNRPISVDCTNASTPVWLREKALDHHTEGSLIRALSQKQRKEYYALTGRHYRPLFDDNYDDTVCLDERHRKAMIAYVNDNPRRAILRRVLPDVMRRSLHVKIGNRSYGAFGNLFLLRWANKVQVQCHRRHPVSGLLYETTDDYVRQHDEWVSQVMKGAVFTILTPLPQNSAHSHATPRY